MFVTNDTKRRLLSDIRRLYIGREELARSGIYYRHSEEEMLKGYAMIVGPRDTPYFGGYYFFEFTFPANYPWAPPTVTFQTNHKNIRFHPNFYTNGKVCLSILNTWEGEPWTACQTVESVLLSLCSLLSANPLLHEPSIRTDEPLIPVYNNIVEYANIEVAVCGVVGRIAPLYRPWFDLFREEIDLLYREHCEEFVAICHKAVAAHGEGEVRMRFQKWYNMTCVMNWSRLLTRLSPSSPS